MIYLLAASVALLSFANGANDNFKGVATLWGARRTSYAPALAWATGFTVLGSVAAVWFAAGLVAKFNGSKLLSSGVHMQMPFLVPVALAAATTVLLASRMGFPISTTHALTGGLVGAGIAAAGFSQVKFAALASGVAAPLLFSPFVALVFTLGLYPLFARVAPIGDGRDCLCVDEADLMALPVGASASAAVLAPPAVRWAKSEECQTGAEVVRVRVGDALHWLSAAAISFARGLNDTPKIAALLLVASAASAKLHFGMVVAAMALGGILGAARVARTLSHKITPMATREAVAANLVSAALVTVASFWALPVSTTHVTSGSIFGIGLLRRNQADWRRVREILLSWVATLPLGALLAAGFYWLLKF
ncbi:MAG: inorganic phosphate transporter [Acidobacteria bacterium]|nr:inorganic phosphate transporter [Acidobacteriota bacterium]